ncbi:COP9 signalosome complex subunit 8 [Histoplasma capsulatum var. duboisii H88]|uniref:COP9 signalosome complex subunit 8 n=1 Tax=Ajellomyces capsulatus (strain H88) TaxID=544711 RepID=F0UEA2_AJEC8|nr:COP9 signalosome complex subunit 8 [Histoplasma capsulatum var. duboisii H88]QSS55401.1 COP9 signalosome complex subunit 8 [Histoplasma capsulatum var. duboisii H88]
MVSLEDVAHLLATAPSSAVLLQKLMELEGDVSLAVGDAHMASDTEFLSIYYSSYFFALLLEDQINEAHMLSRRLPASLAKEDVTIQSTLSLLRAVWNNNYEKIYRVIRTTQWPQSIKQLAQQYQLFFQNKTFHNISHAYGSIRPSAAALYLGLNSVEEDAMSDNADGTGSELVALLTGKGWEWNAESKLFAPKVTMPVPGVTGSESAAIRELVAQLRSHGG